MSDFDHETFREQIDAALDPAKTLSAITAQVATALVPLASRCCLCSIYEPHLCDGWRAEGRVRRVPGGRLFGKKLPEVEVPVCVSCDGVELRRG